MSVVAGTPEDRAPSRARETALRLARDTPIVQFAILAAIFIYGAVTLDGFSSATSIKSMLLLSAFLGIAALGQTILVLLGHLDLSVPGFIASSTTSRFMRSIVAAMKRS